MSFGKKNLKSTSLKVRKQEISQQNQIIREVYVYLPHYSSWYWCIPDMIIRFFITGRKSYMGHCEPVMMFTRINQKTSPSKWVMYAELKVVGLHMNVLSKVLKFYYEKRTHGCHLIIVKLYCNHWFNHQG